MKEIFRSVNQYLMFGVLLVVILYFARTLLIPVVFAAMLAMLMAPLCRRFDRWLPRALSSFLCVFVLMLVLAGIGAVVVAQFAAFSKDVALIEKKGKELIQKGQALIEEEVGISPEKQEAAVKAQTKNAGQSAGGMIVGFFGGLTTTIATIVLTLVFTFLFLFSKEKYETFFLRVFKDEDPVKVKKVVGKISDVSQRYLTGRAMSITIIAILYSIGLSIVGIKNAILLACVAALLTVVPYVGTVLGGLFPVMMALVTEDSVQPALLAVVVMFSIQTIDNYFIEPNIVGGEVNLSALASISSIMAGGIIWGVAGMILFLPMVGIIKIICDHVESLKPLGYVIGDQQDKKSSKLKAWIQARLGKSR